MEKIQGMTADELAAHMPLDEYIPISVAAKILGGGGARIKSLMDLVMTGGLFSWSHSSPHSAPSRMSYPGIGLEFDLPNLMADTDPETVLVSSKDVVWRWCVEVEELRQDIDSEWLPPKELVKARFQELCERAYRLKTGVVPADKPASDTVRVLKKDAHPEWTGQRLAARKVELQGNRAPIKTLATESGLHDREIRRRIAAFEKEKSNPIAASTVTNAFGASASKKSVRRTSA